MKPSYERVENNLKELKFAYNKKCEEMSEAREALKDLIFSCENYSNNLGESILRAKNVLK